MVAEIDVYTILNRLALAVSERCRSGLYDNQRNSEYSELGLAFSVDQGICFCAYWR